MATFNPAGRVERMLEHLTEGNCGFIPLANAAGCAPDRIARKKLWFTIGSMLKCELIGGRREGYYLLPAGRQVLEALRGGHVVTLVEKTTSIRVFA